MAIVIVTQNQYLIASKIHYVNLNETYDYVEVGNGYRRKTVKEFSHNIHIVYSPDSATPNNNNNGREDHRECNVAIRGKLNAHRIFRDLIRQIREQMPDQLFLDKALEVLLGNELSVIEEQEEKELLEAKEMIGDRRTKKARRVRQAKRRNQKVLRRSKGRRRARKS